MKKILLTLTTFISTLILTAQTLPKPDHIIIVMLENKGYTSIIGSSNAPYINSLISDPKCALFSDSHGITHPSQPNYLHLYSGNNQGVTNDNAPTGTPYSTCNLGYSLISHTYTFKGYSEDLPSVGSLVTSSGNYVARHSPWNFWIGTGTNQLSPTVHQPYTAFPAATNYTSLPTVSFIIPNLAHDMHNPTLNGATATLNGDTWLSTNLPSLITWVKAHNSLLIIHYDEDESLLGQPTANKIPTMFIGSMVQGGTYNNKMNHFSILRTIEDMYSLPRCDSSNFYQPITNCWSLATGIKNININQKATIYPVPTSNLLTVDINSEFADKVIIAITDISGRILLQEEQIISTGANQSKINTQDLKNGIYFLSIKGATVNSSQKFIKEE